MATEARPGVGSCWYGGGMTVRVVEVWDDGVTVVRLTGRGRRLKRPGDRAFMPIRYFEDGTMKPEIEADPISEKEEA